MSCSTVFLGGEKVRIPYFVKGDEYMTYSEILKKVREECDMTQAERKV